MFYSKLAELRAARRAGSGFTLIELLVVVVILVALAAIAIPIFLNQKANADDAAAKAAVANVASFVATGIADGSLNTTSSGADGEKANTFTANDSLYNASGTIGTGSVSGSWANADTVGTFCVTGPSADGVGWMYSNTTGAVVAGDCTTP